MTQTSPKCHCCVFRVLGAYLLGALFLSRIASATILTFDIDGLQNTAAIPSDYGDNVDRLVDGPYRYELGNGFTPDVTVGYTTWSGQVGIGFPHSEHLNLHVDRYGNLTNIAYAQLRNGIGAIELTPANDDWSVRINSAKFSSFGNRNNQTLAILDQNSAPLESTQRNLKANDHFTWGINETFNGTVMITFGDNWNVGIDDVNFDQVRRGDFNADGQLDADDIDLMTFAIVNDAFSHQFDLDRNRIVDVDDHEALIRDRINTWRGDADVDGQFDTSDLVAVLQRGKYETGIHAGWMDGDWNADGLFDSGDLMLAFVDGGYEQGPRPAVAATVPEPVGGVLGSIALLLLGTSRIVRKRRG